LIVLVTATVRPLKIHAMYVEAMDQAALFLDSATTV
jgi:hypothetical protein